MLIKSMKDKDAQKFSLLLMVHFLTQYPHTLIKEMNDSFFCLIYLAKYLKMF